jgi:hypothetical protein
LKREFLSIRYAEKIGLMNMDLWIKKPVIDAPSSWISYPSYGENLHLGDFLTRNEALPLWTKFIKPVINN